MAIDQQHMTDKAKEQAAASEEHVRKLLVEFIDQLCRDLFPKAPYSIFDNREEVINIIERFVTKRRLWL